MKSNPCYICSEINPDLSNRENARRIGVGETTVRRHLQANHRKATEGTPVKGSIDVTPDGAQVNNVVVEGDLNGDWTKVFDLFNLDASKFEVVDNTVKMNTWQQSKALDNGQRDIIQLFSYSARFRRIHKSSKVDIEETFRQLRGARRARPRKTSSGLTRVVLISDAQIGKADVRGGTPELLARVSGLLDALEEESRKIRCDDAVVLDPGDLLEGFENTAQQKFTNDLSLPEQLRVARGMLTEAVVRVAALHPGGTRVATVPSNHSAWREGKGYLGKPSDDFGIDTHRAVSEAFALAGRDDVTWVFPDTWDESLAIPIRGAVLGMVHGHQFKAGKSGDWWKGQSHGNGPTAQANILVHGHWHNFSVRTSGFINSRDRWIFQTPTMDNGSSWFKNLSGEESEAGIVTFTIDDEGDWGNLRLIKYREGDE